MRQSIHIILAAALFVPMTLAAQKGKNAISVFTTTEHDSVRLYDQSNFAPKAGDGYRGGIGIKVYPSVKRQTFRGFGTCIGDGNAAAAMRLSEKKREEAARMLFSPDGGNGYVFCRVPMGSNDFSTCGYTHIKEGDKTLSSFNLKQDKKYIIPMLREAQKFSPQLRLMISPWSPPAFMKTTGKRENGGKLLPEYCDAWAEYFARFIKAYQQEGFTTALATIENECSYTISWETCLYTAKEEGDFAANYLRPHLDAAGLDSVGILFWDCDRSQIIERSDGTFGVPGARKAIAGIANHWYGGDYFQQLRTFHERYPEQLIVESEFCVGPNIGRHTTMPYGTWSDIELYGHEIIGCLNNFTNVIFDFNAFLDTHAGPYHNRGNGGIPSLVIDAANDTFHPQPHYYAMAHFSRFIRPGARIVLATASVDDVEVTAAQNPDGSVACVVLNHSDNDRLTSLSVVGVASKGNIPLPAHSLTTIVVK